MSMWNYAAQIIKKQVFLPRHRAPAAYQVPGRAVSEHVLIQMSQQFPKVGVIISTLQGGNQEGEGPCLPPGLPLAL